MPDSKPFATVIPTEHEGPFDQEFDVQIQTPSGPYWIGPFTKFSADHYADRLNAAVAPLLAEIERMKSQLETRDGVNVMLSLETVNQEVELRRLNEAIVRKNRTIKGLRDGLRHNWLLLRGMIPRLADALGLSTPAPEFNAEDFECFLRGMEARAERLRDCELIAWLVTRYGMARGDVSLTIMGPFQINFKPDGETVASVTFSDDVAVITPEARAIITAAMAAEKERGNES
jgi:hypothetical protein